MLTRNLRQDRPLHPAEVRENVVPRTYIPSFFFFTIA